LAGAFFSLLLDRTSRRHTAHSYSCLLTQFQAQIQFSAYHLDGQVSLFHISSCSPVDGVPTLFSNPYFNLHLARATILWSAQYPPQYMPGPPVVCHVARHCIRKGASYLCFHTHLLSLIFVSIFQLLALGDECIPSISCSSIRSLSCLSPSERPPHLTQYVKKFSFFAYPLMCRMQPFAEQTDRRCIKALWVGELPDELLYHVESF
jgi:hypothetical protein